MRPTTCWRPPARRSSRRSRSRSRACAASSLRENAALSLLVSFNTFWLLTRLTTARIRRRGRFGPFRDARVGRTHVHHFVPGIAMMMLAGGASIASADERFDPLLAIPFGWGAALTLDESALLLRLDDVYWTEEGVLSVQIALAASAVASAIALATRAFRRGERGADPGRGLRLARRDRRRPGSASRSR